jgi:hypothetical protein
MAVEKDSGAAGGPRGRRTWLWWGGFYLLSYVVLPRVLEGALEWLVATGGYGLSNAVVGLLALGFCFVLVQRTRVTHAKREAEGDPDPLPRAYDYTTQAQAGLFLGWAFGVLAWAGTLAWLALVGPGSMVVLGPVLGTTAVIAGRDAMAHARAMDARRGGGRGTAG